jgi:uncharacterized protein YeaO (DUF488 family)
MTGTITRKRIYDPEAPGDGFRILVDRLWPRGVRKVDAHVDLWLKDVAPSPALRIWFDHRVDRWTRFQRRYAQELAENPAFQTVLEIADERDVTLLYAAHDKDHNHAAVLQERLQIARAGLALSLPPDDC